MNKKEEGIYAEGLQNETKENKIGQHFILI